MLTIFVIMITGIAVGFLFGSHVGWVKRMVMPLICLLLFLLGLEVGGNSRIIGAWDTIGTDALIIAAGAVMGSMIASWLLWKFSGQRDVAGSDMEKGKEEKML